MNSQAFLVSGVSKAKSFLNIPQNPFHSRSRSLNFRSALRDQKIPFLMQTFDPEFDRYIKQPGEARLQQGRADVRGIISLGVGPDQPAVTLPE